MRIIALIAALFFGFTLPAFAEQGENCYKQAKAKGLKGDERKAFMKECKAARKAEHEKHERAKDKGEDAKEKMHEGKEKMKEGMEKGEKSAAPAVPAKPAEPKK